MFYNDWEAFQNWYCERFQRPNPLPWQDGMQALLWFIKKGLPSNTTVTVTAGQGVETGVNITGDGTPENLYRWDFRINTQPIIDAVIESTRLTAEEVNNILELSDDFGTVSGIVDGDKLRLHLTAATTFRIQNAVQQDQLLAALNTLLEGSESVVVDMNEERTALEIHIDALVMQKINRALLAPVSAPAERSVVAVDTNNSEVLIPVSQLGGGGGSQLYLHKISFFNQSTFKGLDVKVISSKSTPYTKDDLFTFNSSFGIYQSTGVLERLLTAVYDMGTGNYTWAYVPEVVGPTIRVIYRAPGEDSSSLGTETSFSRDDFYYDQVLQLQ